MARNPRLFSRCTTRIYNRIQWRIWGVIRKTVGLSSGHLHPHPAQKHKPWFMGKEVFKQSGNLHWRRLQLVFGESGSCRFGLLFDVVKCESNVSHVEIDQIATAQFTVDSEIE